MDRYRYLLTEKLEWWGYQMVKKFENDTIYKRDDKQTDRQADGHHMTT